LAPASTERPISGTILGLTGIVYLLAPAPDEDEHIDESRATVGQEA
jgi:hypothetical protein